jgi:Flp pilus assembly pilin Flp
MRKLINLIHAIRKDEEGQASTEYVLMLSIVVSLTLFVVKNFIKPTFEKLSRVLSNTLQNQLFGANLHVFRVPRR